MIIPTHIDRFLDLEKGYALALLAAAFVVAFVVASIPLVIVHRALLWRGRSDMGQGLLPSPVLFLAPATFALAALLVGGSLFSSGSLTVLPDWVVGERYAVSTQDAVDTVEDYYGLEVLEHSDPFGEYLVQLPDSASQRCELWAVGESTASGQEAVLVCDGSEPAAVEGG